MESELFRWETWDIIDEGIWQFIDVELVAHIDEFEPGTRFDYAIINVAEGFLTLGTKGTRHKYKLHFKLGDPVIETRDNSASI